MDAAHLQDTLEDTQENTHSQQVSQVPESQALIEKEPWARLYKKRVMRRRLGPTGMQTIVHKDGERDFFGKFLQFLPCWWQIDDKILTDIRGGEFKFGRDRTCQYEIRKDEGIDIRSWNRISKIHFILSKDMSCEDSPILIKDTSRNGTFINGELIGPNQVCLLRTGDVISIIEPLLKSKNLGYYLNDESLRRFFLQ